MRSLKALYTIPAHLSNVSDVRFFRAQDVPVFQQTTPPAAPLDVEMNGDDDRPFEITADGPSPLEQFQTREDSAEVGEILRTLEPSHREVLVLRFYEEMSLEEISTLTCAPLSTVKSRLYRGLASLKPELGRLRGQRPVEARG